MTDAARHLRHHREGVLLADGLAHAVRFILDGMHLVFPVDGSISAAEELVLFVPRESPLDDHELQLLLAPAGEATEACGDRWRAYHGQPPTMAFARFAIDDVKFNGTVVEESLVEANPLSAVEGRLCKRLNADRAALGAACKRIVGVEISDPLAVGVDSHGIDVRARFGIVRVEFASIATDQAGAEKAIDELLRGAA